MNNKIFIMLLIILVCFICYFFIEKRFDSDLLMKEQSSTIPLSNLTNFNWDTAKLSISSEYFEKIAFYNKGLEVYRESVKFDSDVRYESQYLFESNNENDVILSYKCFYSSSIKLKKIEKISEGTVTLYIYEPIGCTPIN